MTQDIIKAIIETVILIGIIGGLVYLGYTIIVSIVREEIKKQAGDTK